MSRILTSPKVNLQVKNRNAIERRMHVSPNYKNILRQKFKERMKNDRCALFNNSREICTNEIQAVLFDIFETDLKELTPVIQADEKCSLEQQDFHMDTSDSEDYTTEEEQWIFDEYNRILESNEALLEIYEQVNCPFCDIGCLDDSVLGEIKCDTCNAIIYRTDLDLKHLEQCLIEAIKAHEDICLKKSNFRIIPDCSGSSICLICSECGYWHHVI